MAKVILAYVRLARYLLRETFWLYLLGIAAFCMLLSIDYLSVWAKFFLEHDATPLSILKLMAYQVPWFLHLSMPIAMVFAVLLATGRLAKDSELKAAYACGVPPKRLLWALLGMALVVSIFIVINNGFIEPRSQKASRAEVQSFYSSRPPSERQDDASFIVEGEGVYYAGRMRSLEGSRKLAEISGVFIQQRDGTQITSQKGLWDSDAQTWTLANAVVILPDGEQQHLEDASYPFFIDTDIELNLADTEHITLLALWERLQELIRRGSDTREVAFALHRQVADAFSTVLFILVAGTLGLKLKQRSIAFAWTIVLIVLFYFLWTLSGDLFERQVLSPVLAAWFTSAIVGVAGLGLAIWRLR